MWFVLVCVVVGIEIVYLVILMFVGLCVCDICEVDVVIGWLFEFYVYGLLVCGLEDFEVDELVVFNFVEMVIVGGWVLFIVLVVLVVGVVVIDVFVVCVVDEDVWDIIVCIIVEVNVKLYCWGGFVGVGEEVG